MEILTSPRPVLSEHTEEEEIHYRDGSIATSGRVSVFLSEGATAELLASSIDPGIVKPEIWNFVRPDYDRFGSLSFNVSGYLWYRLRFTLPNR